MNDLKDHNKKVGLDLTEMKSKCSQQYRLNNTPFSTVCNISFEFPCFRRDAMGSDLFNFTKNRPCINITQIGDGIIDCIGGADEKNLLTCSIHYDMLGYLFLLSNGNCVITLNACQLHKYYELGSNVELDSVCFYRRQPRTTSKDEIYRCTTAVSVQDVVCFNDTCIKDARCDGITQCAMGEDEYWCDMDDPSRTAVYRTQKTAQLTNNYHFHQYPISSPDNNLFKAEMAQSTSVINQRSKPEPIQFSPESQNHREQTFFDFLQRTYPRKITTESHYLPFICNRGLALKNEFDETVCLCPPSFYGELCEFFSDRITIITHLDLKNYRRSSKVHIIKVMTLFLFKYCIIDSYEFHVDPSLQTEENYVKQKIYLLYQRAEEFVKLKRHHRNGTHLYSVRFEAFELYLDKSIIPLAVWQYPVYFDFLPSFRLSKILYLSSEQIISTNNSCSYKLCGRHGRCLPIINQNSIYFCSCDSGYYGEHCENYEPQCISGCSSFSICKPDYGGIVTGNKKPYCLCPTTHYGPTCALKIDQCVKNPCQHDGTCYISSEWVDMENYTCICTNSYSGVNCEIPKALVKIKINSTYSSETIIATTIQYYDVDKRTQTDLILRNRQVFNSIPQNILYPHDQLISPIIGIIKLYGNDYLTNEPTYYLGYIQQNRTNINITNGLQSKCAHIRSLWHLLQTNISRER